MGEPVECQKGSVDGEVVAKTMTDVYRHHNGSASAPIQRWLPFPKKIGLVQLCLSLGSELDPGDLASTDPFVDWRDHTRGEPRRTLSAH